MYKIGIIGREESVKCYKATGFEIFSAENTDGARAGLKKLSDESCAIIFITEDFAEALSEETDKFKDKPIPAIITVPSALGKTGYGMNALKAACERAVGMDILGK